MLDEMTVRKPSFDPESIPVVLGDGGTWWFPRVWVRLLKPTFRNGRVEKTRLVTSGGTDFDQLLYELDSPGDVGFSGAVMNLAAHMLSFNYDLTDEQLEALLSLPGQGANGDGPPDWVQDVIGVAYGRTLPKEPSSPGSEPP